MARLFTLFLVLLGPLLGQPYRLVVISIDGLDHRWLRDCDSLGMKIPNLRRLMREGSLADGVVGIVPTVTWPSHTTMITGVTAAEHGIVSNDQPDSPGQRWWFATFLKTKTLWHLAHEKGMKTAAVWWPVTVGADIDFNLPEFWEDPTMRPYSLAAVAKHSTPGLVGKISQAHPSFLRAGLTDRERILAARYLLEHEQPDLLLLHLGELDSEQHATGAFSAYAKATLEYQDELLASLLAVLPPRSLVAIVSDHGFETQQRVFRPETMLREAGVEGEVRVAEGVFGVNEPKAAEWFRSRIGQPGSVIAREVPAEEVRRMAPAIANLAAVFETISGVFADGGRDGAVLAPGDQRGHHGLWPTRRDYRASFLLWGPGVRPGELPEISMLDIAPTFAEILGLELPATRGQSHWSRVGRGP